MTNGHAIVPSSLIAPSKVFVAVIELTRTLVSFQLNRDDGGMSAMSHQLGVYLHLSQVSLRCRQPQERNRMLVLAGTIASEIGLLSVAAYCRSEILLHNPRHMVRRWPTLEFALADTDFQQFLKQIRRRFPAEKVERILVSHGVNLERERETYYSDAEYAAAILGKSTSELDSIYGS